MRIRSRRTTVAAFVAVAAMTVAGCSSSGGRPADEGGDDAAAGVADTPRMEIAMITHAAPGDTFWDIVRSGAEDAAAKDNVELNFQGDPEAGNQVNLVQSAIDSGVDGIAVTLAKADALSPVVQKATEAGIPVVAFNGGFEDWQESGAVGYFGQDEELAGEAAGTRLNEDGATHELCVIQEQGHVGLEARCRGVDNTFNGTSEVLYVTGTDMPSVQQAITSKLQQSPSIDRVVTLGAPFAMTAVQSVDAAGSDAQVVTFDTNSELIGAIQDGDVQWAIDQQPYLQGYLAVDSLWLYNTNGNTIGGGQATLTGPSFIDSTNVDRVAEFAAGGTR
ncbi:sugar ABC transporter substrate-binding protein [Paenibacillus sp. TRM 82003]|uniref:sugar ABC transporter substrate-binding protein n=1 Tax=Kineococcus sp. TRM81007 TaxID=2925831 RepID=UPI001F57AA1A|nr:sugar ABC transporter substrate-binding protein [Kineococcus sp. TRM81007]MCI2237479.1 sugar ABC transporter substrate-binding protein [Kineococcus sp. TRM81007]MCI3919832.1 sugar ABC transporter substrate-binding protein [Paenibacillus sp. TRM 82003]